MACLIFVDCEAQGKSPARGVCTEIGAVLYNPDADVTACAEEEFHVKLRYRTGRDIGELDTYQTAEEQRTAKMREFALWVKACSVGRGAPKMVSDNIAYDFMWVAYEFDKAGIDNPFGYSGRRLGDYYAGLVGNFFRTQQYKLFRLTKHDHNPVHDARGNAEAFHRLQQGERPPLTATKAEKKRYY
jgi:hypothetical protein